ncbi:DUF4214 domain-containing protein [Devosia sp. RR2S18]|uniref:DUF4214 domain-containing protein n=1 Tax=Devosia rhizosphaerae TaxID=3049774 RepID=UPI00253FD9CB|nr:DUF4214 domain-containing protein [Devosia sp. RR2S18]WIJ26570.1 DUF4214 domain-containing protein [Devosia sp. RR2S18]
MPVFRGTDAVDNLVGTEDADGFHRLGRGADWVDGGTGFDHVNYKDDGGAVGIIADFFSRGNGTVVDTFGTTDTFVSVEQIEGSDFDDQFTFSDGAEFNLMASRGADRIVIRDHGFGSIDYTKFISEEAAEVIRDLKTTVIGVDVDFGSGRITEYDGSVDMFTPVERLVFRGTSLSDVLRGSDDGIATGFSGNPGNDTIVAGDDLDYADFWHEGGEIGSGFTVDLRSGRATNSANSDVDTLVDIRRVEGTAFNDTFIGTDAREQLRGAGGNDIINGGGGIDTTTYWGSRFSEFDLSGVGTGIITVTHLNGGSEGVDTLTNIERMLFDDGVLRVDVDGNAGQAYRLYQAAFERTPDNEGLKYWIGRMDEGNTTLVDIADSFLHSPEFVSTYGTEQTVSNSEFVELLYLHTLGRSSDGEGFSYWVDKLDGGETNRRDLVAFFSESNENKAQVAGEISDGIWLY